MGKTTYDNVRTVAKKSPITKTFKILSSIAAGIVGTIGSVAVLATSVVSGVGYYEHDKVINFINESALKINEKMETTINTVVEQFNNSIKEIFGNVTEISQSDITTVVETINNEFQEETGFALPATAISTLTDSLNSLAVNGKISVSSLTDYVGNYLKSNVSEFEGHITNIFNEIITAIYGEQIQEDDGSINYSKLYIWQIVFISTISVVSVLVLSGLLYLICLGIDKASKHKYVNEAKTAIKNN